MNKSHAMMFAALLALTGCGGGDDDTPAPPPVTEQVPPQASVTVTALIDYLRALIAADADTLEPVDVSAVTPATDETSEPVVVD